MTNRNLTIINLAIVFYFVLVYLVYYFSIEHKLLGVFLELLTLPFLAAQLLFLVLGIRQWISKKINLVAGVSLILLGVCSVLTIGSFFWSE